MSNDISVGFTDAAVLIPAYCPDSRMNALADMLIGSGIHKIFVVDDGSGEQYSPFFDKCSEQGCTVFRYEKNMGKGYALRYGIERIIAADNSIARIITADCDGQHTPSDILKVLRCSEQTPDAVVLGSREFTGNVPIRSRLGNTLTAFSFALASGKKIRDTQTGLRALPVKYSDIYLSTEGNRYEYELQILLSCCSHGISLVEETIETVYLDSNKSSHFNPFIDSIRIYKVILKYVLSSLVSFGIDFLFFTMSVKLLKIPDFYAVVFARVISVTVNFTLNKTVVFKSHAGWREATVKYMLLASAAMLLSYGLMKLFENFMGGYIVLAKLIGDTLIFVLNYFIQKKFIFKRT